VAGRRCGPSIEEEADLTLLRIRAILIIAAVAFLIYTLSPPHRKKKIKGKLKEVWFATIFAVVLYWIYMLAAFAWERLGGSS
jgi:hypothetical protein